MYSTSKNQQQSHNATKYRRTLLQRQERAEYFVSLETSVVLTEGYNVTANSEELIGTTEYLTL